MPNAHASRNGKSPGTAPGSKGANGAGGSSAPGAGSTSGTSGTPIVRCAQRAHVSHAQSGGVHVLRYAGRVNYMSAPAIQRFLDDLLDDGPVSGMVFDLTDAEALDSTNLGLLARVNERVRELCHVDSMIVSRNRDITDVLLSMGFDQSFDLVTDPPSAAWSASIPAGNGDRASDPGNGDRASHPGNGDRASHPGDARADAAMSLGSQTPPPSQAELHATMLEAHRALVRLSEAGRLQFQDVVACLESDRSSH